MRARLRLPGGPGFGIAVVRALQMLVHGLARGIRVVRGQRLTMARCSATAVRQLSAFSKCWPNCSNSGLLRMSYSSATVRSSGPLSLASAMLRWKRRSPSIGMAPLAISFHLRQSRRRPSSNRRCALADERGNLALDQLTRAEDLEQTEGPGADAARAGRRVARDDVHAGADAHFDQALDLERDQRLAHRRPRNPELQRQVALGGQARADRVLAVADQLRS